MSNSSSTTNAQQVWWAVVASVAAGVMVMKPWGVFTVAEWKWLAGVLAVVMLWRLGRLLRTSSSSPARILMWLLILGMAGSVVVVGIPTHWLRVPALSDVAAVVMPILLGMAALLATLVGLAGLNRRRELRGAPQRSYLPLILNVVILISVWQVIRQPIWKESLRGMMAMPQVSSNRKALEEVMHSIEGGPAAVDQALAGSRGESGRSATPLGDLAEAARTIIVGPHSGGGATSAPANAEQWLQAAIHNPQDPELELRACVALVAEGRDDLAIRRLAAARDRQCQSPELIRFHARLLRSKGRPAAAATVLETLVVSPEGTTRDVQEALSAWEQAGQLDRAESLAERLHVRRPSRELFRWLASRDAAAGRYERALTLLGQLSRRIPFDPDDAYQLAEVALQAGRPELALDAVHLLEQSGHQSTRVSRLAARARRPLVEGFSDTRVQRPQSGG